MGDSHPAGALEGRTGQRLDSLTAGSGAVLVLHVVWFGGWVAVNAGAIRGIRPFDPFPFPFLTMTVSLEAIFLALFVLASQNRLARQADKRSHWTCRSTARRTGDDGCAAVAAGHRSTPGGPNDGHARAVARLDEEDRPSTADGSDGGVGRTGHSRRLPASGSPPKSSKAATS